MWRSVVGGRGGSSRGVAAPPGKFQQKFMNFNYFFSTLSFNVYVLLKFS